MTRKSPLAEILESLQLEPHPLEGGYFKRTYTSAKNLSTTEISRPLASSIYYLLTHEAPAGLLHRNRSDIIHCYHGVGELDYYLLSPAGDLSKTTLGWDLDAGHQLQLVVPGGYWKASVLTRGEFGLISEVVVPGFDYADHEIADLALLENLPSETQQVLSPFIPKTGS